MTVHANGKTFENMDEFASYMEKERKKLKWRLFRLYRKFKRFLRFPKWKIQQYVERARYGVSTEDTWSFDYYIAGVLVRALRDLRKSGFPSDMTEKEWVAYLDSIIKPLDDYHRQGLYGADDEERYKKAVGALHKFANRFGAMWD